MKLSKYVESLVKILNKHGDMDCYYSSDDEGNSYQQVYYDGEIFYKDKNDEQHCPDLQSSEGISETIVDEDMDEEEAREYKDSFIKVCVIN